MALFVLVQEPLYGQRDRLLRACTLMGAAVFGVTELLSLAHAIRRPPLFLVWLSIAIALVLVFVRRGKRIRMRGWFSSEMTFAVAFPPAFILLTTLAIAVAAPPNNWDSMTYHMARVANWAANGSIAHYPTNVVRQLVLSPWAEYAILNTQVLSGGSDRWAMLVQWSAFGMCALAVSMILRELKYPRRTQYVGALFVLTIPMAILQSTSTQNDLIASAWIAAFVYFVIRPERNFWFAAFALGLAVNTKGTSALIIPSFATGAWLIYRADAGWKKATLRFLQIAAIALLINLPFAFRNTTTFGQPSGDPTIVGAVNAEAHDPLHILSSIVRQMSLHWGTPVGRVTWGIETGILAAHKAVGIDASDPRTSYTPFHVLTPSNHEDIASNPIHFWLIIAGGVAVLAKPKRNTSRAFLLELCVAFVLFSAILKWQLYGSRLQLPLFVLGGVIAAAGFHAVFPSWKSHRTAALLLFFACLPWLFLNRHRPLVTIAWDPSGPGYRVGRARSVLVNWLPAKSVFTADRVSQMFTNRKFLELPYKKGLSRALGDGCSRVGLVTKEDSWEYPLHVLARSERVAPTFRHIGVENASRKIAQDSTTICAIIVLDDPPAAANAQSLTFLDARFEKIWQDTLIRVFKHP